MFSRKKIKKQYKTNIAESLVFSLVLKTRLGFRIRVFLLFPDPRFLGERGESEGGPGFIWRLDLGPNFSNQQNPVIKHKAWIFKKNLCLPETIRLRQFFDFFDLMDSTSCPCSSACTCSTQFTIISMKTDTELNSSCVI